MGEGDPLEILTGKKENLEIILVCRGIVASALMSRRVYRFFGFFLAENMEHDYYMKKALRLAAKGKGRTSPNPMVGAVLVKNNKIVGKGYHKKVGLSHAEIEAIRNAGEKVKGSRLYLNLEPCSHYGRTPPCSDAIIKNRIKDVIIGMKDPNPLVAGKGIRKLKKAGINVMQGIMEKECREINEPYIKYITKKIPYVTLKAASSLDGRISTKTGESRWITGNPARNHVHKIRDEVDAVMIGINTVLRDDPVLTTRLKKKKDLMNPIRIILDSRLKIPLTAKLVQLKNGQKTIVATTVNAPLRKVKALGKIGVEVLKIRERESKVDMKDLMKKLRKMEISNIMIEGGAEVNASALQSGIVDKVIFFIAPIIIGGVNATSSIMGDGISFLKDAVSIKEISIKKTGRDFMLEGYINRY
ncbi:MAG TPA: bifunctional diaminohydroxyphosphoribosylaminopyrimidine deaminase/5-amino-6-(5-phosphoribosylamino)uracil reductase RibD [Nitrospinota bacterium]|nr:bifunctional diaminohydroxyphosphoribosylaminopyrimidine deaminase/5-amino-6-(5-phosphoribosylamino)uracil reductase RibD [Nitrospinota bacterium]